MSMTANGKADSEQVPNKDFLRASMRLAILNLRTWQAELEFLDVALRDRLIDVPTAVAELDELGLLQCLPAREASA